MKRIFIICVSLIFIICGALFPEEVENVEPGQPSDSENKTAEKISYKNVNIDMLILYGYQYNTMLSTIDLSQEQEDFVCLLRSRFRRSNDYGYNKIELNENDDYTRTGLKFENTSFNENRVGFTANINVSTTWKVIPEFEVDNDSRGMFNNTTYSREETDQAKFSIKNIAKLSTHFETFIKLGYANYVHRLRPVGQTDKVQGKLDKGSVEMGGEYIWSASNRIRYLVGYGNYWYSEEDVPDDKYMESEIIDDVNVTRNLGVSLGINCDLNRDDKKLISPLAGFSIKGYKYFSMAFLYRYDMVPFKPETFYPEQKYINPTYELPPGRVHHGECKLELTIPKIFLLKGFFVADKNNNYYNYESVNGNVLSAKTIPVLKYEARGDAKFYVYKKIVVFSFEYKYQHFDAKENISYTPVHTVSNTFEINSDNWKLDWENKYYTDFYTSPDDEYKLKGVVVGYLNIQRKMLDTFFLYFKVENLYNNRYSLRQGYPEPGVMALGGLRLLI